MYLSNQAFADVIRHTPLFAFDMVIKNKEGLYLLGFRNNAPAKGYWFVPGGRIRKDESYTNAFLRLVKNELGIEADQISEEDKKKFINPEGTLFTHHYPDDNVFGNDFHTHYLVFGICLSLDEGVSLSMDQQHDAFKWTSKEEILQDDRVHANTKTYFEKEWRMIEIFIKK